MLINTTSNTLVIKSLGNELGVYQGFDVLTIRKDFPVLQVSTGDLVVFEKGKILAEIELPEDGGTSSVVYFVKYEDVVAVLSEGAV